MKPHHARTVILLAITVTALVGWITSAKQGASTARVWLGSGIALILLLGVSEVSPSIAEGLAALLALSTIASKGQVLTQGISSVLTIQPPTQSASSTTNNKTTSNKSTSHKTTPSGLRVTSNPKTGQKVIHTTGPLSSINQGYLQSRTHNQVDTPNDPLSILGGALGGLAHLAGTLNPFS